MLNYTSKIQHFLNLHRKHTKYIVVLLLLSAFVASFVCSALTEPAVSMTDPIQMGQNVTLLADGDQSDGLPIISGHYKNSQFKDYIKWDTQTSTDGRLLGSAHNFALFGFESVTTKTPCSGNIISKEVNVEAHFGMQEIAQNGGQSITIATEVFNPGTGTQSNNTILLLPQNVALLDSKEGNPPITVNPIPKVLIKTGDKTQPFEKNSNFDVYAYHITPEFIDFDDERSQFIKLQNDFIAKGHEENNDKVIELDNSEYVTMDQGNPDEISKIKINKAGVHYININYNNLPTGSKSFDLELVKDAGLIINIDCTNVEGDLNTNFQFHEKREELSNNEQNVNYLNGTNVIWNYYDNNIDKDSEKNLIIGNQCSGILLAPLFDVKLALYRGSVIAESIYSDQTFQKAMFMTTVESFEQTSIAIMAKKNWADGVPTTNTTVYAELYRSKNKDLTIDKLTAADKVPDVPVLELTADKHWNDTWFNLDQSYYYYVKEQPVSADGKYYKAEYTNNGCNKTGTVDITNSVSAEIGGENQEPQTIDITIEVKSNPNDLFYNSEHPGKNINFYRSTYPNLSIDDLSDSDKVEQIFSDDDTSRSVFITPNSEKTEENWKYTFKEQPIFDDNKVLYYYIKETNYNNGTASYQVYYHNNGVSLSNATITMYAIKYIDITVKKEWKDSNGNNLSELPSSIEFEVLRSRENQQSVPNGAEVLGTYTISSNDSWSKTIENLPIADRSDNTYYYYIREKSINSGNLDDYNISYSAVGYNVDGDNKNESDQVYPIYCDNSRQLEEYDVTITNQKKKANTISITVQKNMNGKTSQFWTSKTFKFKLFKGTDANNINNYVGEYDLSISNNWQYAFGELDSGYYYRVEEINTPIGFYPEYSSAINTKGTLYINNYQKTVSLNIQKIWDPINVVDKIEYVKIGVYKKTDKANIATLDGYLSGNSDFTFLNNYNVLDDAPVISNEGKTVTYSNLSFTEAADKTNYNYEIRIDLSQFAGNILSGYKINFNSEPTFTFNNNSQANHRIYFSWNAEYPNYIWRSSDLIQTPHYNLGNNAYLILTSYEKVTYEVSSLELTFQNEITTDDDEDDTEPDDEPTIETNGNTVTYRNLPFVKQSYSDHNWNTYIDLSEHSSRKLISATATLTGTNIDQYAMLIFGALGNEGKIPQGGNTKVEQFNSGSSVTLNVNSVVGSNCIVITAGNYGDENTPPPFSLESLVLTFEDTGGNSGISFPTGTWNDTKTELTFDADISYNDGNGQYSDSYSKYNYVYKLPSDAYGKQITKIEYTFSDNTYIQSGRYRILCGTQGELKNTDNVVLVKIIDGSIPSNQGLSYNNGTVTYVVSGDENYNQNGNDRLRALSSSEDSYLVFATHIDSGSPTFQITNLKITFASDALTHKDTIQVYSSPLGSDGKFNESKNIYKLNFNDIDSAFKSKKIKTIETVFHNRDSLRQNDTASHESVVDMYFFGNVNGNAYSYIGEDAWSETSSRFEDHNDKIIKCYSDKSYSSITEFQLFTAYTKNLKSITITFHDDDSKIILTNEYFDSNGLAQQPSSLPTEEKNITYYYDFYDGSYVSIKPNDNSLKIPENFLNKAVLRIEGTFYNLEQFYDANNNNFDESIFNMYVRKDNVSLSENKSVNYSDNIQIKDYSGNNEDNRKNISEIVINTKMHAQNFEKVVVYFAEDYTITIINNKYYEKVGGTPAEGTTSSTTTLPSNGFITEIVLNAQNEWKTTLNQPMVAPDGTVYVYYIIETEIKYKEEYGGETLTGAAINNKFDVTKNKEYLELSDKDGAENLLSITNSLKLTNVNMPSTGGIGTHPYRNAGILMMICSGGIYISLRALRKKQN